MTSTINSDITAWERNLYKCESCRSYWTTSFPIYGTQTKINEEAICCNRCRCIGKLVTTRQEPVRAGRMECHLKK